MFSSPRRGRVDDQLETMRDRDDQASDIESHVDDVAVTHDVVATLEPLLASLAQHRVRTRVEQLLGTASPRRG